MPYAAVNLSQLNKICESIVSNGFVSITKHNISIDQITKLYLDWEKFFSGSDKYSYTPLNCNRFQGLYKTTELNKLLYESFFLNELVAPMMSHQQLFADTCDFKKKLHKIGEAILKQFQQYLGLSTFCNMISANQSSIKIIHYPPLIKPDDLTLVRNYPHEDRDVMTLLPISGSMQGLQFLVNGQWVEPEYKVGDIIVNVGTAVTLLSSGLIKAATHQVRSPRLDELGKARYSMAYFIAKKPEG